MRCIYIDACVVRVISRFDTHAFHFSHIKKNTHHAHKTTTLQYDQPQGPDPEALLNAQAQYLKRVLLIDWLVGWLAALLKGTHVCIYLSIYL